jgi:8-oxo-dGTP diphosphatase
MIGIKTPLLTVDCVVFYEKSVLLIKRKNSPFKNHLALPGGFVDIGETVEKACLRELHEETNLKLKLSDITLLGVYSNPDRDPKRNTISIAYYAKISKKINIFAGDDATSIKFIENWNKNKLAFDHQSIISDAFLRYKNE